MPFGAPPGVDRRQRRRRLGRRAPRGPPHARPGQARLLGQPVAAGGRRAPCCSPPRADRRAAGGALTSASTGRRRACPGTVPPSALERPLGRRFGALAVGHAVDDTRSAARPRAAPAPRAAPGPRRPAARRPPPRRCRRTAARAGRGKALLGQPAVEQVGDAARRRTSARSTAAPAIGDLPGRRRAARPSRRAAPSAAQRSSRSSGRRCHATSALHARRRVPRARAHHAGGDRVVRALVDRG